MLKVIDLIARRQGIGDRLAEGTARLARQIGRGSEEFAMHVKGLECGLHEPRFKKGLGLGFMVNPCGADHCCNMHDEMMANEIGIKPFHPLGILEPLPLDEISGRKASLLRLVQSLRIMCDSLVVCSFVPYTWELKADVLRAVTGWDTGIAELLRVAERILTTARLFNVREGFTSADDVLPERFFQPKTDGVLSDTHLDRAKYEKARSFYYALMAWDTSGVPLPEKVEELEIQ